MKWSAMNWRAIGTLALLCGALLSGWMMWQQRDRGTATGPVGKRPDYVLHDFQATVLDEGGRESFTVVAPKLERDPDVRTMQIATPEFQIPPREGSQASAWTINSQSGWVSEKADEVRLLGGVRAQSANADGKPIKIVTEELNVFPDARRATTASQVTLTQPGLILNGRGLDADLDAKRITLKNDVKARYERAAP
ncbi:LPS export ABC transporter periplasmic protein LptC [Lysobacter soli]|uniref:Lipopolysaccharide export system protein LptC n=1 Tax=Lysobacter soli TaxID=453783 RepID=A0A3D8VD11_9GAMM|nr:LPS export ABC transporter periplasmic protein LptC [Lysobacter soli]RDY67175.1 LPS export ABC transporter periplasmic protein LptC [Lysobacter soli]